MKDIGGEPLPDDLRNLVEQVIEELPNDVYNACEIRGECESASRRLANAVVAYGKSAEDDEFYDAWTVQLMDIPEELAGDTLAQGHYVTKVVWKDDEYWIDLTSAQFPALGYTGPVVRAGHWWKETKKLKAKLLR